MDGGETALPLGSPSLTSPGASSTVTTKKRAPRRRRVGDATGKKRDIGNNRRQRKHSHGSASDRPPLDSAPISRSPAPHNGHKAIRNPAPPHAGGTGVPSPCPAETTTPPPAPLSPRQPPTAAARQGGSRGTGNDITCSASGTCRTSWSAPGAPNRGPRRKSARTPNGRGACGATAGRPFPRRGEGAAPQDAARKASAERVRCVTETTGRETTTGVGPGSAPLPPFHTPSSGGGEEERGPRAEREERSHSPRNVRPSSGAA